jgi:hypothetical protein
MRMNDDDIKRDRSPKSPKQPLEDSLRMAKTLHEKIGRAKVAPEVAAKALGYAGLSGSALTALGTLTSYGLIERDRGVGLTISPLTIQLLHPTDKHQHGFALAESALMPRVFMELYTEGFHDVDVEVIRNHLIQKEFTPEGAAIAATVYVKNFSFANLVNFRSHGDMMNAKKDALSKQTPPPAKPDPNFALDMAASHDRGDDVGEGTRVLARYSVPLGANQATIIFSGTHLASEDFDALADYVVIFKKQFERKTIKADEAKRVEPR